MAAASRDGLSVIRSTETETLSPVERIRRLASLERGDLIVIVVYAVTIGLVSLAVPIGAQALVNTVAFTALLQPLIVLSTLVLAGLFVAGVLRALQYKVVELLQQRFFVRLTHDAARRLVNSDVRAFSSNSAPETMNRFFDVATVQKTAATLLVDGVSVVLQGAVSLVLLAFYHPALLAFDVVLILMIVFIFFGLGRGGIESAIKESKAKYETAAWLEEVARAFRTFKSNEGRNYAFQQADSLAKVYVESRRKHFKVLFRQIVASYVLQATSTAALLGLGGALVIMGELTLGQLVAAELIVTGVVAGVAKFGKYLESYYDLCAAIDKVGVIVDLPEERKGGIELPAQASPAHLKLVGVGYSYNEKSHALRDVTVEVMPGAHFAVLGSDASGKSTLVDVLYGLRAPSTGHVMIDGIDIRTVTLDDFRRDVALVGEPEIVDGTVLENLYFGQGGGDGARAAEVLTMVALNEDIASLPQGALTRLGHGGSLLTSSQAARLAIARCLIAEPRLLIIDETLDGLGTETARKVLQGIASATRKSSVIVFTSRGEIAESVGRSMRLDRGVLYDRTGRTEGVAE